MGFEAPTVEKEAKKRWPTEKEIEDAKKRERRGSAAICCCEGQRIVFLFFFIFLLLSRLGTRPSAATEEEGIIR
jgi:hypothetical protein